MQTLVSVISGGIFVLFAAVNVWIMLTDRVSSKRRGALWMRTHRIIGYAFIALFAVTAYFMFLRLRGTSDELPPRILLHMSFALVLAPLLIAKLLVARYQPPAARGLLPALGISIFALSFVLVAVNIAALLLRNTKDDGLPTIHSAVFVLVVLVALATLLLRRRDARDTPVHEAVSGLPREAATQAKVESFEPSTIKGDLYL